MAVLAATDFFTVEVLTVRGLITYYVLFFIHVESRRICVAGVTRHPDQEWMAQMARNVTMDGIGFLSQQRYLLHDRDSKFCRLFRGARCAITKPIIMRKEITRAKITVCYFLFRHKRFTKNRPQSDVESGWVDS